MAVLLPASATQPWFTLENGPTGRGKVSRASSCAHRAPSILPLDPGTQTVLGALVRQERKEEAAKSDRVHREVVGTMGRQLWLPCSRGKTASQVKSSKKASKSFGLSAKWKETTGRGKWTAR